MKKILSVILICIIALNACRSSKVKESENNTKLSVLSLAFDKQAHRGGRGLMPENTIPAMLDAIDRDVTTLELDLQITKDKKVIVSHDPYFNYKITTTPEGNLLTSEEGKKLVLYSMTYDEISKYDVGLKINPDFPEQKKIATRKPLLTDLIKASEDHAGTKGKTMFYNMEIKSKIKGDGINHPPVNEYVDLVMAVLRKNNIAHRTTIQSFDKRTLQYIHIRYPDMITSYLVNDKEKRSARELFELLGYIPQIFSPDYRTVTPEMVKYCHSVNVKVLPWTVNDIESMNKMKDMEVDGIITDYPNLFEKLNY